MTKTQKLLGAPALTKRQLEILRLMRDSQHDEDGELVYEKGVGYVGLTRVSSRTVDGLLRNAAIHLETGCKIGQFERYTINQTGLELLQLERT